LFAPRIFAIGQEMSSVSFMNTLGEVALHVGQKKLQVIVSLQGGTSLMQRAGSKAVFLVSSSAKHGACWRLWSSGI
jgi:hypothetical protein